MEAEPLSYPSLSANARRDVKQNTTKNQLSENIWVDPPIKLAMGLAPKRSTEVGTMEPSTELDQY